MNAFFCGVTLAEEQLELILSLGRRMMCQQSRFVFILKFGKRMKQKASSPALYGSFISFFVLSFYTPYLSQMCVSVWYPGVPFFAFHNHTFPLWAWK